MNSTAVPRAPHGAARVAVVLLVGGLVLAACGTPSSTPTPRVEGTPATSISVPLTNVGCTRNDVCVAVGAAATSGGLAAVGEFATARSPWIDLTLPATDSPLVTATACAGTTCLIGGSEAGSDLLWSFSASSHQVSAAPAPAGGVGVDALSCGGYGCALVDTAKGAGPPRLSITTDDASTWSTPEPMTWAGGDAVSSLACASATDCLISALTASHQLVLYATSDAGVTWGALATPAAWSTLASLTCEARRCVGLADADSRSLAVRTSDLGRRWTHVSLGARANALACATFTRCVAVGQRDGDRPWLAGVGRDGTSAVRLRYVPTPLLGVACGSKLCAAIGVTTLVSVPLPL